jgi:hypothetical protein
MLGIAEPLEEFVRVNAADAPLRLAREARLAARRLAFSHPAARAAE